MESYGNHGGDGDKKCGKYCCRNYGGSIQLRGYSRDYCTDQDNQLSAEKFPQKFDH